MYVGLKRANHVLVGWSWGLWDWNWYRPRAAEGLATRLLGRVSSGDILVMHDGHHENPRADRQYAVEATAKLVPALQAKGFTFGTICEGLSLDAAPELAVTGPVPATSPQGITFER
jgi:peptidoglycan/xylan/chitin deacetylase (PgdA/CDA1 family)